MTECQGCGAWNDASRTVCVLCGTPLAETDEWDATADPPPLPPLPDGGLASAMPSWLREPPAAPARWPDGPAAPAVIPPSASTPQLAPLGPRADPRTFLTDDDFPVWLRELAARQPAVPNPAPGGNGPSPSAERAGAIWPDWPESRSTHHLDRPTPTAAAPDATVIQVVPPADRALPTAAERREHEPWEAALLVLLFLGIIAAAVWALISYGVFDPFV